MNESEVLLKVEIGKKANIAMHLQANPRLHNEYKVTLNGLAPPGRISNFIEITVRAKQLKHEQFFN